MNKKIFTLYCLFSSFCLFAKSQNVSSPYSILGIGDIECNDYGRYSAAGNAAVSRREIGYYNFTNPASLTSIPLKQVYFDFAFNGRISTFQVPGTDTFTQSSKDFVVKRASVAFKVTNTLAFAFGIKPFSSSNYQYLSSSLISDGSTALIRSANGNGGLYQPYLSVAKVINKHFSVGVTGTWLFGSMQSNTEYFSNQINFDILKSEVDFYNAVGLQGGIQYYSSLQNKWQHSIGFTASFYTKLKGQNTIDYTSSNAVIQSLTPQNIQFQLPVRFNAGYSLIRKSGLSFHLQGNYDKWQTQSLYYQNSYTKDAVGFSAGMEYSKKIKLLNISQDKLNLTNTSFESYYFGWGVKMQQSYMVINNNRLTDYAITFGGGKNISRFMAITTGIEIGKRGTTSLGQIRENYFQFSAGLTVKDIWLGTKKFGRYN